ncbi:MAG: hypothetical protein QOD00_1703 [Blastocatellia bacterium]|jgi:hypothetical protein|nr:hypothetical protein [Blastocatellia bacterium]
MSVTSEAVRKFLQADTGAGGVMALAKDVYDTFAPEGSDGPYVLVRVQSPAIPSYTVGGDGTPYLEESVIATEVVDQNLSAAAAEDLAARIKTVMQDAALEISGQETLWCRWRSDLDHMTIENKLPFQHKGQLWNVKAGPAE